jgi:N6-adenosine-specific RNA methylase IME4
MATMVPISEIDVKGRSRKAMGDIASLADSIERVTLLHPIVLTSDKKLVVGRRRIEAFKKLGRDEIPANIARNLTELNLLLEAERDENTCREPYTPEEAVHLGGRIETVAAKLAREAQQAGKSADGQAGGRGKKKNLTGISRKDCRDTKAEEARTTKGQAAAAVGMDRRTYEKAKAVVNSGDRDLIDEMNRTGKVNGAHKKLVVAQKSAAIESEPPPLPEGQYRVIVADPPWQYDAREEDPSHRAANPYPSMSIAKIKALDVGARAHDDSVLWLWTTNAHLREAFEVVEAWGFTYKTMLTWGKQKMGTGDWLRGKTEHCLMCVRGKPTIRLTNQTTLLIADSGKHSAKPEEFYAMIEKLCPGSKLEMFARKKRTGASWNYWGDEIE